MNKKLLVIGICALILLVVYSGGCTEYEVYPEYEPEEEEPEQKIELITGNMEYTNRIEDSRYIFDNIKTPETGKKFFLVFITVKNNDKRSHTLSSYGSDITLTDTNKKTYGCYQGKFDASEVQPGYTISGTIGFEIPESSIPYIIYLEYYYGDDPASASINSGLIKENYNKLPVADAGNDQTAFIGDEVTLDGSKSKDPEGGELEFKWEDEEGKGYSWGASSETEKVTYNNVGTYTVTLTVTDDCGLSDTDTVTITVKHYFELTANNHGWYETLDPFDYHKDDYEVSITMKNISPDSKTVYSTFFKLVTSDGNRYDWNGDDDNDPDSLSGETSASWIIYFEVPESKMPVKIIYSEDSNEQLEAQL